MWLTTPVELDASGIFRRLFDAHPHPAWVIADRERRVVAVNPSALEVYGVVPTPAVPLFLGSEGPTRSSSVGPGSPDAGGAIRRYRDRHGARTWVEVAEIPLGELSGERITLVWARDVTERHLGDDRRRLLEAAVEAAGEIILVTSSWGGGGERAPVVVYANGALERVTGWSAQSLLGRSILRLVHADTDRRALDAIGQALEREASVALDVHVRHQSGAGLWMEVTLSPHRDLNGEAGYFVWTLRDVTRRRLLQEQLVHASGMDAVGRVAGSLTHDFNNLLTIIAGSTSLAQQAAAGDDARRGYLHEIEMATTRARALTGQLLAVSRSGGRNLETLDASLVLRDLVPLMQRLAGPEVLIEVQLPAQHRVICVDRAHLEQLILNLVANARDALPQGGTISVRLDVEGTNVRISVCDDGCGMDPLTLERAREPFFTTKPRGKGTGLGLSTAHLLTEQYGGRLELESVVGEGTAVAVILPAEAPAPPTAPEVAGAMGPKADATPSVLLVEDDPSIRLLLGLSLRESGCRVREGDGTEPPATLVADGPYALVISDLNLGTGTARGLLDLVRETQPQVPILCISGYNAAGGLAGVEPRPTLLPKPFNLTEFSGAVQQLLVSRHGADCAPRDAGVPS
ncbi:PAS domain S-box protein [Paraconexibacter antarcticus]|uniref:histidine kinase n=1 Tax=Paraconexibacter antarcticus TaxID=2949664 RepID=A0ABY5DZE3_9ACTN|nr:PAS domain S-box protein [Paraconexibacter antarcticus]UTI66257.1 PAS domain S-box protein [Paraconexibacter antarcticus]